MNPTILLRGILIGFSIAAPVGPIGVLCIRRTLAEGRLSGLVSGLGAATADACYGIVAGFGLTIISNFLIDQSVTLNLFGGLFLIYLGLKTFFAMPPQAEYSEPSSLARRSLIGNYVSTFFLTITNPLTILSFVAIFAGLGLGLSSGRGILPAAGLVAGVFLGSAAWWITLSGIVAYLRRKVSPGWMLWINRISGSVITVFGILALVSLMNE
jgi:threonine/homoserine/homoserine lactone efflux protein